MPECQNCGEFVTEQYVRVFTPEAVEGHGPRVVQTVRTNSGTARMSVKRGPRRQTTTPAGRAGRTSVAAGMSELDVEAVDDLCTRGTSAEYVLYGGKGGVGKTRVLRRPRWPPRATTRRRSSSLRTLPTPCRTRWMRISRQRRRASARTSHCTPRRSTRRPPSARDRSVSRRTHWVAWATARRRRDVWRRCRRCSGRRSAEDPIGGEEGLLGGSMPGADEAAAMRLLG